MADKQWEKGYQQGLKDMAEDILEMKIKVKRTEHFRWSKNVEDMVGEIVEEIKKQLNQCIKAKLNEKS